MQLSYALSPAFFFPDNKSEKRRTTSAKPVEHRSSKEAVAGINAYIAIRDMCLAEAEKSTTDATLSRVCMANEVVATCLKSARSPYEAQHLPETDAVHERERCEAAKIRIAELAGIATARFERAHAG
jgi:hypothetical protein